MSRRRWSLAVALVLTGCATTDELTSRLASQEPGASIAVIPPRPGRERVQVSEEQFQATLRALVAEIRFPARLGSRAVPRVMPAAWTPLSHEELALARDYRLWCEHRHRMSDCLGLLRDRATLRPADRYKIAFDIALGSQWDGFTTELRGMVDPAVVRVT
ncbi:MAG TPA: hypothetical protein VK447_01690, partial [Myxococcaceae bacterium]|nr:hypothetical protein [Myxococcaceae bacterium]